MKGGALRDEEFVDVARLFQFSADRVPDLAENIGGIQRPLVASPGGVSFDIGQLKKDDREAIPLEHAKPVILRPMLMNAEEGADTLNLTGALGRRLSLERPTAPRSGKSTSIVYIDAADLPGATRPSGLYTIEGKKVKVKISLIQDQKKKAQFEVEGTSDDQAGLVDRITQVILQLSDKL
jgi:hypothetical protein